MASDAWEATVRTLPFITCEGVVWRVHWRDIPPSDWRLSLHTSGRYHQGRDLFPEAETWPALYTSLDAHVAVWEMVRQRVSHGQLSFLRNNRLSQLHVSLRAVLDCRDTTVLGLPPTALTGGDPMLPRLLAASAVARAADALLVPSAALTGHNAVILPSNLPPSWTPTVISTEEMPLDVPRRLLERS